MFKKILPLASIDAGVCLRHLLLFYKVTHSDGLLILLQTASSGANNSQEGEKSFLEEIGTHPNPDQE